MAALGPGWTLSQDRAWELSGDASGLHVLVADAADGYELRTVATLAAAGVETDRWIGNACMTASGTRLVVAYAPRGYTNEEDLFLRGAFTAVVDLTSGAVTVLPVLSSLEYFSPSCGHGEEAVLTVSGGEDVYATRLVTVDAAAGAVVARVEAAGQLTSAVLTDQGIVAAASDAVVRVDDEGTVEPIARAQSVPYGLRADADGGLVFLDHDATTAHVRRLTADRLRTVRPDASTSELARGPLTAVGVTSTAGGRVLLTGSARATGTLPATVQVVGGTKGDRSSVLGEVTIGLDALLPVAPGTDETGSTPGARTRAELHVRSLTTGRTSRLSTVLDGADAVPSGEEVVHPSAGDGTPSGRETGLRQPTAASRSVLRSALHGTATTAAATAATAAGDAHNPLETERTCAVPRNDPGNQALQPKPRQVEWAVDQAVQGSLNVSRPANWKNLGMSAYDVSTMFPAVPLAGGGQVPAQVMLGILAQESNLWQAPGYVVPGVTGSPLIGNYYGVAVTAPDPDDRWRVDWSKSDCGYGVAQVTDGMRLADTGVPGSRTYAQQRAIALDFVANVAAGLQILSKKWNETRAAGLTVNDGNPARIENWYYAVWAYNTGFYPQSDAHNTGRNGEWGVGWLNNPANPSYPPERSLFNKNPADATHPQDWAYPEKVLGFAAFPPSLLESPNTFVAAYRAAWWPGDGSAADANRTYSRPPLYQFCDETNDCVPGTTNVQGGVNWGPCAHRASNGTYDGHCWYHGSVVWKYDCQTQCGRPFIRFVPGYAYQDDGTAYPPNCSRNGLPSGALVVDDIADTAPIVRPGCARSVGNQGTFTLDFAADSTGHYPSKIDFHQLGAGYNGHFWFGHTRSADLRAGSMRVTGTWALGRRLDAWTRIMVHVPDLGAHTQEATYLVDLGDGRPVKRRVIAQRWMVNTWVSLGVFDVHGIPKVTLSTETTLGDGADDPRTADDERTLGPKNEDIAFDAVAFAPLAAKPANFVVALGDSFSSGEGGTTDLFTYDAESDNNGTNARLQNACHRSPLTWSRVARLPDSSDQIRSRVIANDPALDYHLLACSGAVTRNLLPTELTLGSGAVLPRTAGGDAGGPRFGELSQLDQGFLDENTTVVTLSIGGNDAGFGDVLASCITDDDCSVHDDGSGPASVVVPQRMATTVQPSITTVLGQIHLLAPNARVVLMGYPRLITRMGCGQAGLSEQEIGWLASLADVLAGRMAAAVADANTAAGGTFVTFVDPRAAFDGKGACGTPPLIHSIIVGKTPGETPGLAANPVSQQSFHPNADGYRTYGDLLTAALVPAP
ncbi:SGNH/GDSL hydrolase family protein [Cellulomonas sp.]|uniref:SGNH/GDSL hydrolase family protein n=1 Tax=Cellulomonas sp. TaxID=40001 RepID=UPI001B18D74F|nr:SGNH/GDSL hydrolase family protein [Cellulomonas sp.]MBO9555294.1 SGNH/GDSL hydrolase family protein [Cellulomonas sp.]